MRRLTSSNEDLLRHAGGWPGVAGSSLGVAQQDPVFEAASPDQPGGERPAAVIKKQREIQEQTESLQQQLAACSAEMVGKGEEIDRCLRAMKTLRSELETAEFVNDQGLKQVLQERIVAFEAWHHLKVGEERDMALVSSRLEGEIGRLQDKVRRIETEAFNSLVEEKE